MASNNVLSVPGGIDINQIDFFGFILTKNLARRQLVGHFQISQDNGTKVSIEFRLVGRE